MDPKHFGPVEQAIMGEGAPGSRPGADPELYGQVELEDPGNVEVRSFQTLRITYHVGKIGIDDTGAVRLAWRFMSDGGKPQTRDPTAANYVSAKSSGAGRLVLEAGVHGRRPWNRTLTIFQRGGFLKPGETIEILLGDTGQGSPGMAMQTFAEVGHEIRFFADIQATGVFEPLPQQLWFPLLPGPAAVWRAILPTLRRPGEIFRLGLKAEDRWGNPTGQAKGRIELMPSLPVDNLPKSFDYTPQDRTMLIDDLSIDGEGELRIRVLLDGREVCEAGPLFVHENPHAAYWGDLHGQTGETIGVNTIESYADFARNKSFLDVSAHQGNDFQITAGFWRRINQISAETDEPGRFVFLPGYEWSGNTAVGGDHNVFFRHEGRKIRRCSHALIADDDAADETDAHTLCELYAALQDEDAVIFAHVGGRYADIAYAHDPRLETSVELHSAWGSFAWILTDSLALGRRVGVVANSDGHKGRPGASYPGSSTFGAYGGLTCFLTDKLDRDSIFEAMRRRHHYATSGCRIHIDFKIELAMPGMLYLRDPKSVANPKCQSAHSCTMGDIVRVADAGARLRATITAPKGIERVDIMHGARTLKTCRSYGADELGNRIRVLWSGAEYRGRGRETHWRGRLLLRKAGIERFERINCWNPERLFDQCGSNQIVFDSVTTGNFAGLDLWHGEATTAGLAISTNLGDLDLPFDSIGFEDRVMDAGGLQRQLRVFRLPSAPLKREIQIDLPFELARSGDNPIWICVTTEDGYQAWTSPAYLFFG